MRAIVFLLLITLARGLQAAPAGTVDVVHLRNVLGKGVDIFEVKDGEVAVGLPYLKRLEVSENSVLLTVRNDSKAPITPRIEMEFFNAQGMRLCETFASFETEGVPAGSVTAKQVAIIRPELERIFAASVVPLPNSWKTICFVAIRNSNERPSPPSADSFVALANPRPRPTVVKQQQVRPAILAENKFGSQNIGPMAVDARWSNYGAYLQRMIESVQIQWERLLREAKIYPSTGSTVTVKFVLDSDGQIARIALLDSTADDAASRVCLAAITSRAHYGMWTEDMKAVLGEQQEMTYAFYYQ